MGQGAPPRVITRTSGTVSVQLSRQSRVHPIASAIRSVRVSLTTDIAWSMASSIARLGQNWPVLALSPSSTSVYPSHLSRSSELLFLLLASSARASSLLVFLTIYPSSVQVFYPSRRRVAKRPHIYVGPGMWACERDRVFEVCNGEKSK